MTPADTNIPSLTGFEKRLICAIAALTNAAQSPTVAEIARQMEVNSRGSVHRYLQSLITKGCLQSEGRGWRSIRLTTTGQAAANRFNPTFGTGKNTGSADYISPVTLSAAEKPMDDLTGDDYRIPLLGKIAAGKPIEAMSNEDTLDLAGFFIGPDRYALRVTGDSMIEAGILDGDTVIIKKQSTARTGDIVVALIDRTEATLKRLGPSRQDKSVELQPENTTMKPMRYAASRVEIQGVLVGQLRSY